MNRPRAIRIEASSHCQLRCPSCPTTTGAIDAAVGRGFLKLEDFRTLLDDSPWVETVELSNYGEIFLNPELAAIIECAHARRVVLTADNGVNLNHAKPEVLEAMVKFRFKSLLCSIDGASEETYGIYRVRGSFGRVIDNIRALNRLKEAQASRYPLLCWQFVVFGHNEHEIPEARRLAAELGMEFRLKLSWDEGFSPIRDRARVRLQLGGGAVSREEHRERHGTDYMQALCKQLWLQPQINWDGKILGCCRNFWGDFGGNAFTDGLAASLSHEKLDYARGMLRGEREARADIPCTTCEIYAHRKAKSQWIRDGA